MEKFGILKNIYKLTRQLVASRFVTSPIVTTSCCHFVEDDIYIEGTDI